MRRRSNPTVAEKFHSPSFANDDKLMSQDAAPVILFVMKLSSNRK